MAIKGGVYQESKLQGDKGTETSLIEGGKETSKESQQTSRNWGSKFPIGRGAKRKTCREMKGETKIYEKNRSRKGPYLLDNVGTGFG